MSETSSIAKLNAPFGQEIELMNVVLENNVTLLRVRIREGRRFTVLDIDPATAEQWSAQMANWSRSQKGD